MLIDIIAVAIQLAVTQCVVDFDIVDAAIA